MTFRAVLIGLVLSVALASLGYVNDTWFFFSYIGGDLVPTHAYGLLLIGLLLVNPLLRLIRRFQFKGGIHGTAEMDLYTHFQKSNQTMIGAGSCYHRDYPYDSDAANADAIMKMMQAGMVTPAPAITHCVPYTEGPKMYKMLAKEKEKAIGVQFDWRQA